MKKSRKKINLEDLIKEANKLSDSKNDINQLLEFVNDLNEKNFEDINLDEIDKKTDKFKKKYKNILPEESEDNVDSKE